jgi:hypothetical protein
MTLLSDGDGKVQRYATLIYGPCSFLANGQVFPSSRSAGPGVEVRQEGLSAGNGNETKTQRDQRRQLQALTQLE